MILTHLGLRDSKSSTASEVGVGRASALTARARDLETSRMWGKETFPMDPAFREFREQSHGCSDRVTDQPACSVLNPRAVLPQAGVEDQGSVLKKFPCSSWIPDLSSLRTGPLGAGSSRKQWHAHQFTLIELPPEPRRRVRGRHGCLAPRNEISPDCLTDRK